MNCPNATDVSSTSSQCALLPGIRVNHRVCGQCQQQWDNAPPTSDRPTPIIVELQATFVPSVSRGLGDTVAKITSALGIPPCGGCGRRRQLLNKLIPYRR